MWGSAPTPCGRTRRGYQPFQWFTAGLIPQTLNKCSFNPSCASYQWMKHHNLRQHWSQCLPLSCLWAWACTFLQFWRIKGFAHFSLTKEETFCIVKHFTSCCCCWKIHHWNMYSLNVHVSSCSKVLSILNVNTFLFWLHSEGKLTKSEWKSHHDPADKKVPHLQRYLEFATAERKKKKKLF